MVDNKHLTNFISSRLDHLSYEEMVNLYDTNCSNCPFNDIQVVIHQKYGKPFNDIMEAISYANSITAYHESISIVRACKYGGEYISLKEITSNTCRFWRAESIEGGKNESAEAFIEITTETEIDNLVRKYCESF